VEGERQADDVVADVVQPLAGGLLDGRPPVGVRVRCRYSVCSSRKAGSATSAILGDDMIGPTVEVSTTASATISSESCGVLIPNASTRVPQ
jgi:hypothetical protein